ncbi:MAG: ABC transporter ATP-binding protein [Phycisphaerales bacterium]|nr:MAG: ABC transporter ATP-binding protein [Phycisphaerales bacterium]
MDAFWHYARGMLRYKRTLVLALMFAFISASGLGAGLIAIQPVLELILNDDQDLPGLLAQANTRGWTEGRVPDWLIEGAPPGQFTAVAILVGALGVLTIVGGAANFLHQYLALTAVFRTATNLRRKAFYRVLRMPLSRVVTDGPSNSIARIVMDTAAISAGFNALVSKGVAQATKGLAAFIAALILNPVLSMVSIVVALVLYTVIRRLGKTIRRASKGALGHQQALYAAATEALQGLRVVKVHTTERYEAGRFHKSNKASMKEMMRLRTARALASPLVEAITLLAIGFLVLVAVKAILDGHMEKESFLATLIALGAAGASLKPLTGLVNDIQQSAGAAERIREMLDHPDEPGHGHRLPKLPRHRDSIVFDNVTFSYPGSTEPAVRGVSLHLRCGETVAVVGPNGSGKTTLLALVPRLFEASEGRILVDGVDIRDVSVRSLRSQIGVVTQETVLFRGTVRSNIAYGAGGATDEMVHAAADRARATEFISKLPNGYETEVGEQGLTLSGGQRQRIAIARAMLRDPAILILDEATSMVDADSEQKIADAITEFASGRTCLIVAHRLSTVVNADRIVVMEAGRVVDIGTHTDLLERCDVYKTIAQHQLVGGDAGALAGK